MLIEPRIRRVSPATRARNGGNQGNEVGLRVHTTQFKSDCVVKEFFANLHTYPLFWMLRLSLQRGLDTLQQFFAD